MAGPSAGRYTPVSAAASQVVRRGLQLVFPAALCYLRTMFPYHVIRSRRKTLALQVTPRCEVLVRAPLRFPEAEIERFVALHQDWIGRQLERQRQSSLPAELTEAQFRQLKEQTRALVEPRVAYYARKTGLIPTGIRITRARSRYGSCSARNSLCFSCFLALYPPEAVDLVVVHELVHIQVKNHGPAFYARLEEILPDWKARKALLRQGPHSERSSSDAS